MGPGAWPLRSGGPRTDHLIWAPPNASIFSQGLGSSSIQFVSSGHWLKDLKSLKYGTASPKDIEPVVEGDDPQNLWDPEMKTKPWPLGWESLHSALLGNALTLWDSLCTAYHFPFHATATTRSLSSLSHWEGDPNLRGLLATPPLLPNGLCSC